MANVEPRISASRQLVIITVVGPPNRLNPIPAKAGTEASIPNPRTKAALQSTSDFIHLNLESMTYAMNAVLDSSTVTL